MLWLMWQVKNSEYLSKDKSLLDLGNICLMRQCETSAAEAQAVVVATGSRTRFGSLAKSIVVRVQTAFDRGSTA